MKLTVCRVLLLLTTLTGCAESSAQVNTAGPVLPAPDPSLAATVAQRAAGLPGDSTSWRRGVVQTVTAEGTWYARVVTRGGAIVVLDTGDCNEGWMPDIWWRARLLPGDRIAWSTLGGDNNVCAGEVRNYGPGGPAT